MVGDYLALVLDELRTIFVDGRDLRQRLVRALMLALWLGFFPAWVLGCWLCLGVDRLVSARVVASPLVRPLIIVGNHRTGSTFLHRLLSEDTETFSTCRLWDLFLPAIVQKRLVAMLGRLDGRVGRPLGRLVDWLDARWATDYREVHPMGIRLAEEDEFLLFYTFKSSALWELHPRVDRFRRFFWMDAEMEVAEADGAMAWYAGLARRCHAAQGGAVWMSKNPLFTPKIRALRRAFPDARFLVLQRDPRKVVPSTASLLHQACRGVGAIGADEVRMDLVHEICTRFYDEPLEALDGLPPEQLAVLRYEELRADLVGSLEAVLTQLELPMTEALRAALARSQARPYRRTHSYALEDWGLDEAGLVALYREQLGAWGYLGDAAEEEEAG